MCFPAKSNTRLVGPQARWLPIAAPVQCDVDGIPKGLHHIRVPSVAVERHGHDCDNLRVLHETLLNSMVQLVSHVCPALSENACSHRAWFEPLGSQIKRTLIGFPLCSSSP